MQRGRVRHALGWAVGACVLVVVVLGLLTAVPRQQSGVLALAAILLPHLYLAALLLVPLAVGLRHRVLGVTLVLLAVVAAVRLGPDWVSLPRSDHGRDLLTVATWNVLSGGTSADAIIGRVLATNAEVVAIQELTPDVAAALSDDRMVADRFPHQWLAPHPTVLGLAILSAHPLERLAETPTMTARADLGAAGSVIVINGHPLPGRIGAVAGIPVAFNGSERDAAIGAIREHVEALAASGERVVVTGDYNVTPTEAGYRGLADGLRDAHAEAGNGTGWTWRPLRLAPTGIAVLRIDYVLTTNQLEPIGTELQCDVPGDHCLLLATLALSTRD